MDFIQKKREADRTKQQKEIDRYGVLLRKMSAATLTAAEEKELSAIIDDAKISLEKVEADQDVIRRFTALDKQAAQIPDATEKLRAAQTTAENLFADHAETRKELAAKESAANAAKQSAERELKAAEKARTDRDVLAAGHWRLFGVADPAVQAQKRHLAQVVFIRPRGEIHTLIEYESVMVDPTGFGSFDDPARFIPLPGQSAEELADLIDRAQAMAHAAIAGVFKPEGARYLLEPDPARTFARCDRVSEFDPVTAGVDPNFQIDNFNWQTAPGQTEEQLDALLKKFRSATTKARKELVPFGHDRD